MPILEEKFQKDIEDGQRPSLDISPSSLAAAFVGEIERPPVSATYKVGLALAAFGMLLLATAYIGMIVFVAYGIYHHLHEFFDLSNRTRDNFGTVLYY